MASRKFFRAEQSASYGGHAVFGVLLISFGIGAASAQSYSKVGDLLDSGGQRVPADALKTLLSGAKSSGRSITRAGNSQDLSYLSNGQVVGSSYGSGDQSIPLQGTWMVNDQGFLCTDIYSNWGSAKGCYPWYRKGEVYYAAESEDRNAIAHSREIKR